MFCSRCGAALAPGQAFCPQCGQAVTAVPPVPPVPNLGFQVEGYRGRIRVLAIVWFVYAGVSLLLGFAALTFARQFFTGGFGPWTNGGNPPVWLFPAILHFAWVTLVVRTALGIVAGWGLLEHERWGRILAIVIAFLSLLHFPFGTALGIWTLVVLLGYRNATLYEQL